MREAPPQITPQTSYFQGFALAMYDNARWLIEQEMYTAAVLVAQAAVEMGARMAFIGLLWHDQEAPVTDAQLRALPDVSFMAEDTRRLWTQLVGGKSVKPRDPPVWKAYQQHVEYRNRIAHGDLWGDSVGFGCVVAAGAFVMRLDEHMQAFDEARAAADGSRPEN